MFKWIFVAAFAGVSTWYITRPLGICTLRVSKVTMRQSNLRSIATLLKNYAQDHDGQYASRDKFQLVMQWGEIPFPEPVLGPDETQDDIWMSSIPWEDQRIPEGVEQSELAQLPMLHNKVDLNPDGTSVAFWDGSVRILNNEEFAALIDVENSVCLGCQFPVPEFMREPEP